MNDINEEQDGSDTPWLDRNDRTALWVLACLKKSHHTVRTSFSHGLI